MTILKKYEIITKVPETLKFESSPNFLRIIGNDLSELRIWLSEIMEEIDNELRTNDN